MITKPTVLVLGAGASMPYNFPSAKKLRNIVLDNTFPKVSLTWANIFSEFDFTEGDLRKFGAALQGSGMSSVDAFLEYRTDLIPLGKMAIATALIPFELENDLYIPTRSGKESWYEFLWNKIRAPIDVFQNNNISIITFNYDRSIEQYLFKCVKDTFNLDNRQCYEKLNAIPIVHVHGSLGALPWQLESQAAKREYMPNISGNYVYTAAQQIRIISDEEQNEEDIHLARSLLLDAKKIFFLGFGYHDPNMERLLINKSNSHKFFGTGVGLGTRDYARIRNKWGINIDQSRPDITRFFADIAVLD